MGKKLEVKLKKPERVKTERDGKCLKPLLRLTWLTLWLAYDEGYFTVSREELFAVLAWRNSPPPPPPHFPLHHDDDDADVDLLLSDTSNLEGTGNQPERDIITS